MCLVTQSCLTLCDPLDYRLPSSSVHGILQARILEWVAIPFPRGSSQPKDRTQVSCIAGGFFNDWATPGKPEYVERWEYSKCQQRKEANSKSLKNFPFWGTTLVDPGSRGICRNETFFMKTQAWAWNTLSPPHHGFQIWSLSRRKWVNLELLEEGHEHAICYAY